MATFIINKGYGEEHKVEADRHSESGSFVIFYDAEDNQVYSGLTSGIRSIERLPS